jgi:tetratricopeptide (TPR) repeat protein
MVPEKAPEDAAAVARAHLELGRTWRRLGKLDQAEEALLAASRIPSQSRPCCDALHDLASLYRKTKRKEPALAVLQRIVEEFPGEPRSRAEALMRIAGWQRDAKEYPEAEETLRRCLKEHADLWRPSVDALDDLVALKIRQKAYDDARQVLDAHTDSIRARFAGSAREESVENALMKMGSRGRLEKVAGGGTGKGQRDG